MGAQFIVVRFFHEIATIVWIGGMIFQAIALTPVLKKLGNEAQLKIRTGVIKIFGKVGIVCIILIVITGILMSVNSINNKTCNNCNTNCVGNVKCFYNYAQTPKVSYVWKRN